MPHSGKRKLSGRESQQRAKAMACIRDTKSTKCQGQIHIGLFFDGTGNNHTWVEEEQKEDQRARNKHSNVARLWDAHLDDGDAGFFKVYIPGVGTPFKEIGDSGNFATDYGGNGFGYMGADRINWAILEMFNAMHAYASGEDLFTSQNMQAVVTRAMSVASLTPGPGLGEGARRWASLTAIEEKLARTLKKGKRKVVQVNVSIYGFSRGAAEARACAHWIQQIAERDGGAFQVGNVPVRIGFLGIFDTVAAVGIGDVTPFTSGHMAWGSGTQSISSMVEECAHFIALHEQRASFPLESATGRGNVGYPGMHSDVGGGYYPGEQGKALKKWDKSPHLSQIPLLDMHFAAIKAGVPLRTIGEIHAKPALAASFSVHPDLLKIYNRWLTTSGVAGGPVKKFTEAHTMQYIRWRGMMYRDPKHSIRKKAFYAHAPAKERQDLWEADSNLCIMLRSWEERKKANATFMGRLREAAKDVVYYTTPMGRVVTDGGKAPLSSDNERFLKLFLDAPVPPAASIELFEHYVHDSRAGFRVAGGHEPEWLTGGYARFRNVFLQGSPDEKVTDFSNAALKQIKATANDIVEFFQEMYEYTMDTYEAARAGMYRAGQRIRREALQLAKKVEAGVHQGQRELKEAQEATEKHILKQADEMERMYMKAQRDVVKKYNAAEKAWRKEIQRRWAAEEAEKH